MTSTNVPFSRQWQRIINIRANEYSNTCYLIFLYLSYVISTKKKFLRRNKSIILNIKVTQLHYCRQRRTSTVLILIEVIVEIQMISIFFFFFKYVVIATHVVIKLTFFKGQTYYLKI